jgi:carbon-monoxide dehydrogenase medium subunit
MLKLRDGARRPDLLIDLSGLRELAFIRDEPGMIRIGALTTFAQIQRDATLARHAHCLARAAAHVGSAQIRNVATLGGNVANASPCADAIPALLALGADVGVLSHSGAIERRPLHDLLAAAGGTTLRPGEAVVDLCLVPLSAGQRSAFGKVGARSSVAVAKLNAALVIRLDGTGQAIADARIAFGSVAAVAFVDGGVSAMLRGTRLDAGTVEEFASACSTAVSRSIPDRSSLSYKRHAVRGLAHDLWAAIQAAIPS